MTRVRQTVAAAATAAVALAAVAALAANPSPASAACKKTPGVFSSEFVSAGWFDTIQKIHLVSFLATDAPGEAPSQLGRPEPPRLGREDGQFSKGLAHVLAAVLVILVLGGVGIFVLRRLLPRMGLAQGRRISVLETVYLSSHKSLHLVGVGDRTLLLAGTRERLSLLADLTGAEWSEGRSPPSSAMRNSQRGMRSELGTRNAELGTRNAELGTFPDPGPCSKGGP
jgi:flagellar biogenesis protein FliO